MTAVKYQYESARCSMRHHDGGNGKCGYRARRTVRCKFGGTKGRTGSGARLAVLLSEPASHEAPGEGHYFTPRVCF
jgi:hypothetical protein